MQKSKTMKKLTTGVTTLVFMLVCLCAVTFAMMVMDVDVKNNVFNTGKVEINLNDGNPVIEENEFDRIVGESFKTAPNAGALCEPSYWIQKGPLCGPFKKS